MLEAPKNSSSTSNHSPQSQIAAASLVGSHSSVKGQDPKSTEMADGEVASRFFCASPIGLLCLARVEVEKKRYSVAYDILKSASKMDPNSSDIWRWIGHVTFLMVCYTYYTFNDS